MATASVAAHMDGVACESRQLTTKGLRQEESGRIRLVSDETLFPRLSMASSHRIASHRIAPFRAEYKCPRRPDQYLVDFHFMISYMYLVMFTLPDFP